MPGQRGYGRVDAVTERAGAGQAGFYLTAIQRRPGISATARTLTNVRGRAREELITLRHGDDLCVKTLREEHAGYRDSELHVGEGYVEFAYGQRLILSDQALPARTDIFRVQIERTIEVHIRRQAWLQGQGIKILSLFFIDPAPPAERGGRGRVELPVQLRPG